MNSASPQRPGWPKILINKAYGHKDDRERMEKIIFLRTGLESKIEKITQDPYERWALLVLAFNNNLDPGNIPLDDVLYSGDVEAYDNSKYGLDALSIADFQSVTTEALKVKFDTDLEYPTIKQLAAETRKRIEGAAQQMQNRSKMNRCSACNKLLTNMADIKQGLCSSCTR